MNKILLHSAKVLSIGLLLSIASTKAMNDLSDTDWLYNLPLNTVNNVENANIPVSPVSEKNAEQPAGATKPVVKVEEIIEKEIIKEKIEVITEAPAGSTVNTTVSDPTHGAKTKKVPASKAKPVKVTGFFASLAATKNSTVNYLKEFRARGWQKWTTKERAAVVVTTAAVVGLVAYGAYKVYEAYTKEENKKNKKTVRRTVRA